MKATPGPGHLLIARVLGIPIYLHFSWLVIFALIVWTLATGYFPTHYPDLPASSNWAKGLVASLLFFVSILLHELGHALVGRSRGLRTRSIVLFVFGGVAQLEEDPEDGRTEFWMAAAGPAVSLLLALLFQAAGSSALLGPSASAVAHYLALINLALALFNLVPAFPLDGGRILRGLLWRQLGKKRATRIAAGAGSFFAFFLIAAGVLSLLAGQSVSGIWYILLGWFLKDAAGGAYKSLRLEDALGGVTVRDAMLKDVATLPAQISLEEAAHDHFLRTGYGGYPVVRGEEVVGLLCLRDILRLPPEERSSTAVQSAMAPLDERIVIAPEAPLLSAMAKMAAAGTGRLLALENGELAGMLTMNAVVRHVRVREELAG
jgi:Zn-dependent protease/CBS domain-containing protein